MSRRTYIAIIVALTIVAVVRVAATHRVFNATVDEPVHLAAGWLWLSGTYNIDLGHPPLARVLSALPLRLAGLPDPPPGPDDERGNTLLYHGDRYLKNLARARSGNLLLLIAATLAVAAQARRTFNREVSIVATTLFTNLPPILAHAGLMTTDMAVTAALPLALLALDYFLELPTTKRAALLGAAIGMGVLAKFSFLLFFPVAAIVQFILARRARGDLRLHRADGAHGSISAGVTGDPRVAPRREDRLRRAIALVLLTAFLLTWAGYLFTFGRVGDVFHGAAFFFEEASPKSLRLAARWFAEHVPVPAPALLSGLSILKIHDDQGHLAVLFGERREHGWWYYFPVVFFYKTPLPFLALAAAGIAFAFRRRRGLEHALIPAAILLVAMTGSINIGVRHVLPMYTSLAVIAGYATVELWRKTTARPFAKLAFIALTAWLFIGSVAAHPDYLAWFNEAAGKNPGRIAADSNLDWGQDVMRLERAMRELKIDKVSISYSTGARLEKHIPTAELHGPVSGWVVIGETQVAMWGDRYPWLTRYEPVRRIGKSMRLYYVPQ